MNLDNLLKELAKVREEAAIICSIAASNTNWNDSYEAITIELGWMEEHAEQLPAAYNLALEAWIAVGPVGPGTRDQRAEALIRDGWLPPIELDDPEPELEASTEIHEDSDPVSPSE